MSYKHKLLILDYGGVYSFEYNPAAQDTVMKKSFGKVPTAHEYAKIHPLSLRLASNKIDSAQYVEQIAKIVKVPKPDFRKFEKATISVTFNPSMPMVTFVQELRATGLLVSLLSDMFLFEVNKTKPWGRYDGFDFVSLSAEIGSSKDTPEPFKRTLEHFDISAKSALFVDDKMSNIESARSAGLDCLWANHQHYTSAEELIADIRKQL